MATIFQSHDVNLNLNGQSFFCSNLNLSQEASFSPAYNINESVTNKTTVNSPVRNRLSINYFFSGKDFLRDYILINSDYPLTGRIAGLQFNQGYLESYNVNATPQSLININASLVICDEMSGNLNKIVHSGPPTGVVQCTTNNITFNTSNFAAFTIENIRDFNWNYVADVEPIYFQKETGLSHINPDRVIISNKEISCDITTNSNNNNLLLPFTGDNYAIEMLVKHPTNTGIFETFGVSGKINKKDFSIGIDQIGQSTYSITQYHLNEEPKINDIDVSNVLLNNYIKITSPNLTNGYFTTNKKLSLIERVILGDRELKFNVIRGANSDTITGYIPNDAINGTLQIHTSKGLIIHPSGLTLNFSGIGVSGFTPDTGNFHDTILISGTNFFRISQVLFNNVQSNFQIKQNTGIGGFHELIASVPDNTTVGSISVISSLKNRSGISTGIFYPIPIITGFTPTGMWSGLFDVEGKNFSGITNVYFNSINALGFGVVNQNKITGRLPGTGAGFTKGYVKVSGYRGMEGINSFSIYHPVVPISGISSISGTSSEDLAIYTIFDRDYLNEHTGVNFSGYKVAFGKATGLFFRSGNSPTTLTGLIPTGFFDEQYISLFEPDGITKYPPFTGKFTQVGPAPKIDSFSPKEIHQYQTYTLNLEGENFKDFFLRPYYALISGVRQGHLFNLQEDKTGIYTYSDIEDNNLHNKVQIPNVKITGHTGYYDIYVCNYVGSGFITGLKVLSGIDWANTAFSTDPDGATLHFPATSTVNDGLPARDAIDGGGYNSSTRSRTYFFNKALATNNSGYWRVIFENPIDIHLINFYQNPTYISDSFTYRNQFNTVLGTATLAKTGLFQLFDNSLEEISYTNGINWNNATHDFRHDPFTGVRMMKLSVVKPDVNTRLSWNTINVY